MVKSLALFCIKVSSVSIVDVLLFVYMAGGECEWAGD